MKTIISTLFSICILGSCFAENGAFSIRSPAFEDRGFIPISYSCRGDNLSPELFWQGTPSDTRSFILVCHDPDAPKGKFIHWLMYNIPATTVHLEKGIQKSPTLPNGSLQGINSFNKIGYDGPCPPPLSTHHYIFTLYALNAPLHLKPGSSYNEVDTAMRSHILAQTTLTGLFQQEPH